MIIQLPNRFEFCENGSLIAWVEKEGKNKILKILPQYDKKGNQYIDFRSIMTELTYVLKGRNICAYCGKEFNESDMSVDHIYPYSLGGPTIPENMVPSCKECNEAKSNLTVEEYFRLKMLSIDQQESFKKEIQKEHEEKLKKGIQIIPNVFFAEEKIGHIIVPMNMSDTFHSTSLKAITKHYKMYQQYKYPIIVDSKNYLLDGLYTVIYAKKNHDTKVPAVKLENVDVILD